MIHGGKENSIPSAPASAASAQLDAYESFRVIGSFSFHDQA